MDKVQNNDDYLETTRQKRERNANFTQEETNLLVSLIAPKKYIIENKKSDGKTWQEKDKAWKQIAKAFNLISGSVFRDHKHLKSKYEAIKRDIRKKSAMVPAKCYKTGHGTSPASALTAAERKVKEMVHSVKTNENRFDSDIVLASSSTFKLPADEQNYQSCTEQTSSDSMEDDDDDLELESDIQEKDNEPPTKKLCETSQSEAQIQCKPKETRPFDALVEEKIEIAKIQKKNILEELEQKIIHRKILEKELEHKDVIHELEKEHLLLKIQLLKKRVK